MPLSAGEKIRIILKRRGKTIGWLADELKQTRPNLSNKLGRDNLGEVELKEIAAALNCTYETVFTMNDNGEKI